MRQPFRPRFCALVICALAALPVLAAPAAPPAPPAVSARDRAAIVDDITAALRETYVFPDVARKMEESVRRQLASGAYDRLGTLDAFTARLTADLQAVSHDLHLEVGWTPEPPADGGEPDAESLRAERAAARRENYCFRKVERLAGNVGYLKLDCFEDAEIAGDTAVAAMGFLAGSDALIFDLRDNVGGSPTTIQLLLSYLLPAEPALLNSFQIRKGDKTVQHWTQAWVPGTRLPAVPVFVLTSSHTFSAGEEFAYDLQSLKRATVVGEATAGGAHPVEEHRVKGYPVTMRLPYGQAVNPVTGSNWEEKGVAPDVRASAAEALAEAHRLALAAVAEKAADPAARQEAGYVRGILEDRRKTVSLSAAALQELAGTYGPRTVTAENGALWYQRGAGLKSRLVAVGEDRFLVEDRTEIRFRFERDASGHVVRLIGLYPNGQEEPSTRDGERSPGS